MEQTSTAIDFSGLTSQLSSTLNATTVLTVMGAVIGATATIFLAVWGGRKIINSIQEVMNGGSLFSSYDDRKYKKFYMINYYGKYGSLRQYKKGIRMYNRLSEDEKDEYDDLYS